MKTKRKFQRLEVEPAYEQGHLIAHDLIERIEDLLSDLPAPGDDDHPLHWGHVGTINAVNAQLFDVIDFLSNR